MMLTLVGLPFEDVRIDPKKWPALKPTMPFEQLPLLELIFNGKKKRVVKITQSHAILRYLGQAYGFSGRNHLHNAMVDELADAVDDASRAQGISDWPLVLIGKVSIPEEFGKGLDKGAYFTAKVRPSMEKQAKMIDKFLEDQEEYFGGRTVT